VHQVGDQPRLKRVFGLHMPHMLKQS